MIAVDDDSAATHGLVVNGVDLSAATTGTKGIDFTGAAPTMTGVDISGNAWAGTWDATKKVILPPQSAAYDLGDGVGVRVPAAVSQEQAYALAAGETTYSRERRHIFTGPALTSGALCLSFFTAHRTEEIASVKTWTGGTAAAATPTLCRIGVYSEAPGGALTLVASTPNDTALWAAAYTEYEKDLSVPWAKVRGQRYAIGLLCISGAAVPTLCADDDVYVYEGVFGVGSIYTASPRIVGSFTGQTDLPASIAAVSLGGLARRFFAQMLP